ncbi:CYTH domain-containing protein [Sutcliffiella cohnii]
MHQEIEIEFKNIITKDEYSRLLKAFQHTADEGVIQINHYLDTPDFHLKQNGCALRIREKNKAYQLTLKQPAGEGLLETHETILQSDMNRILDEGRLLDGGISSVLKTSLNIDPTTVQYFGSLTTNRVQFSYENGLLVLDESNYLGVTDYELEYEASSFKEGKIVFERLLHKYEIPIRPTKNKIVRFYEQKKALEGDYKHES